MNARRGFTILELILAAGIGSMVLISGAVLFSVMDRSDTAARRRFEASSEMQRTRLIMQRAFSQMLMSDEQKPLKQTETPNDASKAAAAASKRNGRDPDAPLPPPRLTLGLPETQGARGTGMQRLEVCLFESPVPTVKTSSFEAWASGPGASRAPKRSSITSEPSPGIDPQPDQPREEMEEAVEEAEQPVRAYRGAFEFLPQTPADGERTDSNAQTRYQLWWVPMPARRAAEHALVSDSPQRSNISRPYLLCSDILYAGWRLYDDGQRKTSASAIWDSDLPAYIEFEIRTASGLQSQWMFEVGWANGPEYRRPLLTAAQKEENRQKLEAARSEQIKAKEDRTNSFEYDKDGWKIQK